MIIACGTLTSVVALALPRRRRVAVAPVAVAASPLLRPDASQRLGTSGLDHGVDDLHEPVRSGRRR